MNFVIKNHKDGSYLSYDPKRNPQCRWVEYPEDASHWGDLKRAHNFMTHNYTSLMRFVPASATSIIPLETTTVMAECPSSSFQEGGGVGAMMDAEGLDNFTEELDDVEEEIAPVAYDSTHSNGYFVPDVTDWDDAAHRMESLPNLGAMVAEVRALCRFFEAAHRQANMELTDIMHKIELDDHMSAAHRAMLFKRLRQTLRTRRVAKDNRKRLNLYYEAGVVGAAYKYGNISRACEDRLANRKYAPRALPELFAGDSFAGDMYDTSLQTG